MAISRVVRPRAAGRSTSASRPVTLYETLTAADGDTVTITCHQVADPTQTSGVYLGIDKWIVTGGTGQFSGATGAGVGTTSINLNNDTFAKAEAGTVT